MSFISTEFTGNPAVDELIFGPYQSTPPLSNRPVVTNFSPAIGSALGPQAPVAFNVTSPNNAAFRSIVVVASYPNLGLEEVVHDGNVFGPNYSGTRSAITHGFAYLNITRIGGWPESPTFVVNAVDVNGLGNA